jgi:hypothetical protein
MNKTYQFQTLGGEEFSKHNEFMDAWNDMYQWVKGMLDKQQLNPQLLETSIWIEVNNDGIKSPILFYDARDIAIMKWGWKQPK